MTFTVLYISYCVSGVHHRWTDVLYEILAHVMWRVGEMHSAFLGALLLLVFLVFCGIANTILCVLVFPGWGCARKV